MGSTSKSVVDMIEASSKVHYSGFHMNGHISGVEPSAALQGTTDIQRQPFVIGLSSAFFFSLVSPPLSKMFTESL